MTPYYACYARSIQRHLALRDRGTLRSPTRRGWFGDRDGERIGRRKRKRIANKRLERDLVAAKAADAGMRPATYIRHAALRSIVAPVKCDIPAINREAWASLARVCANLNQYQLAINEGRATSHSLHALQQLREQVEALRRDLIGIKDDNEGQN